MSDLATLYELINGETVAAIEDRSGRKSVVLEESGDGQQAGYSINLSGLPEDLIAIKADQFPPPDRIFKNTRGECKRADYILIAQAATVNWIVYIEMKGGKVDSREEVVQQLKGAECLLAYIRAVGCKFWRSRSFLHKGHYRQRFVCIEQINIPKKPTRELPLSKVHDTPEDMLRIVSPRIGRGLQFRELVRNS